MEEDQRPKTEDQKEEPKDEQPAAEPPKEEKKKEKPAKPPKPKNCIKCNKVLARKGHYYRNGKYFCSKRCFKALQAEEEAKKVEEEKKKAEAASEAVPPQGGETAPKDQN